MSRVLVVDDDPIFLRLIRRQVQSTGFEIDVASSLSQGFETGRSLRPDVVLLDVNLPDGSGLEAIPTFKRIGAEVIIITALGDPNGAELAIRSGAWNYLTKPIEPRDLSLTLARVSEYRDQKRKFPRSAMLRRRGIIGHSQELEACLELLSRSAPGNGPVLITGPTGTGKELFARAVHDNSARADQAFVTVDCAALPDNLVEGQLFGHVKGAFTGAERSFQGLIRQADGGTLFLDEVGELPLETQKSFLRVLVERRFRPVGSDKEATSDFRLVSATNRDLQAMADQGAFRPDLLYRLQSAVIDLPLLKDRGDDLIELINFQIGRLCTGSGIPLKGFSVDFLEIVKTYTWPGNIRELFHTLEQAVNASHDESMLYPHHLPQHVRTKAIKHRVGREAESSPPRPVPAPALAVEEAPTWRPSGEEADLPTMKQFKENMEREYLLELMRQTGGNVQQGCRLSGLSTSRLYALLKKHNITRPGWGTVSH